MVEGPKVYMHHHTTGNLISSQFAIALTSAPSDPNYILMILSTPVSLQLTETLCFSSSSSSLISGSKERRGTFGDPVGEDGGDTSYKSGFLPGDNAFLMRAPA